MKIRILAFFITLFSWLNFGWLCWNKIIDIKEDLRCLLMGVITSFRCSCIVCYQSTESEIEWGLIQKQVPWWIFFFNSNPRVGNEKKVSWQQLSKKVPGFTISASPEEQWDPFRSSLMGPTFHNWIPACMGHLYS